MTSARGYAILTLKFRKEGGYWLGECEELGTATDGRSFDRVRAELARLVVLHLSALQQIGERERVFKERGVRCYRDRLPLEIGQNLPVSAENQTLVELIPIPLATRRSVHVHI